MPADDPQHARPEPLSSADSVSSMLMATRGLHQQRQQQRFMHEVASLRRQMLAQQPPAQQAASTQSPSVKEMRQQPAPPQQHKDPVGQPMHPASEQAAASARAASGCEAGAPPDEDGSSAGATEAGSGRGQQAWQRGRMPLGRRGAARLGPDPLEFLANNMLWRGGPVPGQVQVRLMQQPWSAWSVAAPCMCEWESRRHGRCG